MKQVCIIPSRSPTSLSFLSSVRLITEWNLAENWLLLSGEKQTSENECGWKRKGVRMSELICAKIHPCKYCIRSPSSSPPLPLKWTGLKKILLFPTRPSSSFQTSDIISKISRFLSPFFFSNIYFYSSVIPRECLFLLHEKCKQKNTINFYILRFDFCAKDYWEIKKKNTELNRKMSKFGKCGETINLGGIKINFRQVACFNKQRKRVFIK